MEGAPGWITYVVHGALGYFAVKWVTSKIFRLDVGNV